MCIIRRPVKELARSLSVLEIDSMTRVFLLKTVVIRNMPVLWCMYLYDRNRPHRIYAHVLIHFAVQEVVYFAIQLDTVHW